MVVVLFVYIMLIQRESERDNWCALKKGESNLCWDQNLNTIETLSDFERKRTIKLVYLQRLKEEQSCAVVPTIYSHHIMPCHAICAGIN